MYRVLGIDPGSKSWDFFGLEDDKIILDTSLPTKELISDPQKALTIINSVKDIDLMVAPSGFGLPLKDVHELTEQDIFFTLLKFDQKEKNKLVGLGEVLRLIKAQKIAGIIVPGVKHLPTVPRYQKINKIDMGTADKICTAVTGIRDQIERFKISPEDTNFIMVEIGYGFTAVLAIEDGQIIDGIGGSNIMGFRACGVAYISGYSNLSLKEITLLAKKDNQTKLALKAYLSSVKKAVFGISSSFTSKDKIKEVLLAGRGSDLVYFREKMIRGLKDVAPVRTMKSFSQISKRAAQGAAFIANGILGGRFEPIIDNLKIKEATGSILDDIFIPFEKEKLMSDLD